MTASLCFFSPLEDWTQKLKQNGSFFIEPFKNVAWLHFYIFSKNRILTLSSYNTLWISTNLCFCELTGHELFVGDSHMIPPPCTDVWITNKDFLVSETFNQAPFSYLIQSQTPKKFGVCFLPTNLPKRPRPTDWAPAGIQQGFSRPDEQPRRQNYGRRSKHGTWHLKPTVKQSNISITFNITEGGHSAWMPQTSTFRCPWSGPLDIPTEQPWKLHLYEMSGYQTTLLSSTTYPEPWLLPSLSTVPKKHAEKGTQAQSPAPPNTAPWPALGKDPSWSRHPSI